MVACAAEPPAGEFAVGAGQRLGGLHEDAENHGRIFLGEAGFDDESAEHDFGAGIGFAFGHAELGEVAVSPEEQTAQA